MSASAAYEAIALAQSEVERCQRNLGNGGNAAFWRWRLNEGARHMESAAALLRVQLERLPPAVPEPTQGTP